MRYQKHAKPAAHRALQQNTRARKKLADYLGKTVRFRAIYACNGAMQRVYDHAGGTVLLTGLRTADGREICSHIWVHRDAITNPEALAVAGRGGIITFYGEAYCYIQETRRKAVTDKYSIGAITIETAEPAAAAA